MLASLSCAPGGWLAVVGRAASPSEKTARVNIVPQVREEVKRALRCARRAPARAGCRSVRDSTLAAWYRSVYAPRTGGAYDRQPRTTGIAGRTRRRGGRVAARGARAAGGKGRTDRVLGSWPCICSDWMGAGAKIGFE